MSEATLPAMQNARLPHRRRIRRGREAGHPGAGGACSHRLRSRERAVRDGDGRTYAGTNVHLPSLSLTALQYATVSAVVGGADVIEAAAVVTEASTLDTAGQAAVRDVSAHAPIHLASPTGSVLGTFSG